MYAKQMYNENKIHQLFLSIYFKPYYFNKQSWKCMIPFRRHLLDTETKFLFIC